MRRRQEGGQGREPRAAPQRGSREAATRRPPPHPPHRPARRGGAGHHPPRQGGWSPLPPPERGAGAQPAPPPRPPAPTGTAGSKRARANAPGRRTDRAKRRRASMNRSGMGTTPPMTRTTPVTPALLPAQGRQRDRTRQSDPPPYWPPLAAQMGGTADGPPPQPAPRHKNATDPPNGGRTAPSQVGGNRDRTAPLKDARRSKGPGQDTPRGTDHVERPYRRPVPGPREVRTPTHPGGGGGSGRRGSASAHTRKGHAGTTRRATGPSSRNAKTAWNGVPASEGKGHPDGTARHTQCGTHGAGRGKRERHNTRYRPEPPELAASAAHTRTGHCTCQGSSGALRHAPTPRLGSLRASPRGSHWRQASSTGPAAPAPRATTH